MFGIEVGDNRCMISAMRFVLLLLLLAVDLSNLVAPRDRRIRSRPIAAHHPRNKRGTHVRKKSSPAIFPNHAPDQKPDHPGADASGWKFRHSGTSPLQIAIGRSKIRIPTGS